MTFAVVNHTGGTPLGVVVPGAPLIFYTGGHIGWSGFETGDSATINAGATSFDMTAPSGFAAWDTSGLTAWDPVNKGPDITLSSSNMLATSSAGGSWTNSSVRSNSGHITGKWYYEVTATSLTTYSSTGIVAWSDNLLSGYAYIGSTTDSFGYISDGDVYTNGSRLTGWQGSSNGMVTGIAVDFDAQLIWARTSSNGNWNNSGTADPTTGTGGLSFTMGSSGPLTAPTTGNLLIALIGCNIADSSITIGSGWQQFDYVQDGNGQTDMTALYRYAQAGDAFGLPPFWSAGSTFWSYQYWEVSGVSGTWANDFLASIPLWNANVGNLLPEFPIFADGLALTGTASYGAGVTPTISGSWTLDDVHVEGADYGSEGGAHRVVSNGDVIDGQWSSVTSSQFGGILILLTTAQPSGGVYPSNVFTASGPSGAPGAITVPWVPQVGALLVAYIHWGDGNIAAPDIGTGWTQFNQAALADDGLIGVYRYVQMGDTSTLPALTSSGSNLWAVSIVELHGDTGSFSTDHASDQVGAQASGTTFTTTADATTANNQFGLLAFGNYSGTGLLSQTGFTNFLANTATGNYGTWGLAFDFFPTSGTTVQSTVTPSDTSDGQFYIQSIFNDGSGGSTINASDTEAASAGDSASAGDVHSTASDTEAASASDSESASTVEGSGTTLFIVIMG